MPTLHARRGHRATDECGGACRGAKRVDHPALARRGDAATSRPSSRADIEDLALYMEYRSSSRTTSILSGVPTTAGCPRFRLYAHALGHRRRKLLRAGAIPLGKTNLDQFATGLSGNRSPYGACRNSFNAAFIAGGSSSGSAVAVASGLASFSLGTDTAGSGRVPAAFNNVVGLKPSLGRLSTRGVVPACRSLDCVSIFALDRR